MFCRFFIYLVLSRVIVAAVNPFGPNYGEENIKPDHESWLFKVEVPLLADLDSKNKLMGQIDAAWKYFKLYFKRSFNNIIEEAEHFFTFAANFVAVMEHNIAYHQGKVSYQMGINAFSDKKDSEKRYLRGYRYKKKDHVLGSIFIPDNYSVLPSVIDWRHAGAVTGVKDQGQCGSCWAFSATGAIEGQNYRKAGHLVSLSEQQLVDCSSKYGNDGCEGGYMEAAFEYVKDKKGIDTETSYPYVSGELGTRGKCRFNMSSIGATVTGFVTIPSGDENLLKQALATRGPISVAINAELPSFMWYKSGIYSDFKCSGNEYDLDHGVLLVGYGEEGGIPYWLVKNSWGTSWGDHGYIKIRRNLNNMCGIATDASYPLV